MFASTSSYPNPRNGFSALYRSVAVETAVPEADPHHLVSMLFDGLLDCIAQARGAIREANVEAKCRAITRAVRIVDEGLKAGLNLQEGGPLATDLDSLYSYLMTRLTQANLRSDDAALAECARLIQPLRDAWASIGPSVTAR